MELSPSSTAYHPQTKWASGKYQIVWLEKNLERTIGENRAPGRTKLYECSTMGFRTAYKKTTHRVLLLTSLCMLKIFSGQLNPVGMALFTSLEYFRTGNVELSQANGPNFKVTGHPVKALTDCPDCEDSQFCHSSRVSHPQLHLGIRYPNLID
ncbi:hypothetical protein Tco_1561357 [Tanacetum coccineum]